MKDPEAELENMWDERKGEDAEKSETGKYKIQK
jgi:hypothetical protein